MMRGTGLASVLVLAVAVAPAAAQETYRRPSAEEATTALMMNALAGGLTAGFTAALRGESIADAFFAGAAGGSVVYLGKRVAVSDKEYAGLVGRGLAAFGSSVVANVGSGRHWSEEVWLPIGPVWLQVSDLSDRRVRVSLMDVWAIARYAARSELELDWARSASNGVPVFESQRRWLNVGDRAAAGMASGGVMALSAWGGERTRAHEMIHVIQHDFVLLNVDRPLEARVWRWTGLPPVPVDLGIVGVFARPSVLGTVGEVEADLLDRYRPEW